MKTTIKSNPERNEFANVISIILDETGLFTRQEWADNLFVTTSTLSQWTKGKTSPRPDHLQKIIACLEKFNSVEVKKALGHFYKIADKPLKRIMPIEAALKFKGANTLADYLIKPYLPTFLFELSNLPAQLKRESLFFCNDFFRIINSMTKVDDVDDVNTYYENIIAALQKIKKDKLKPLLKQTLEADGYKARDVKFQPELIHHTEINNLVQNSENGKFVLECFDKVNSKENESLYRFNIILWTFSNATTKKIPIPEIDVDEILFIKFKGSLVWTFDGLKSFDLSKNNIISIRTPDFQQSDLRQLSGLPCSEMIVKEKGYAIAILYKKEGLRLETFSYNQSLYELFHFPSKIKKNYLHSDFKSYLKDVECNCAYLSFKSEYLKKAIRSKPIKYADDNHQYQRDMNQMTDAFLNDILPNWYQDDKRVLSIKLAKFNEISNQINEINLSRHYGSEVIIPLSGRIKLISAGVLDHEPVPHLYPIKEIDKADRREEPIRGMGGTHEYPNILVFNSETPHAFMGLTDDAICLHIRVLRISKERTLDKNKLVQGDNLRITPNNTMQTITDQT